MKIVIFFLFTCIYLISCHSDKTVLLNNIQLTVPQGSKLVTYVNNSNSFTGKLQINGDTFYFEKSKFTYNLKEYLSVDECLDCFGSRDTVIEIYPNTPEPFFRYALNMKHYFTLDTTNGIKKIIKQPKDSKTGETGVFIENIDSGKNFVLYSKDLTYKKQLIALKVLKSIILTK
jgi:hypothetical protein